MRKLRHRRHFFRLHRQGRFTKANVKRASLWQRWRARKINFFIKKHYNWYKNALNITGNGCFCWALRRNLRLPGELPVVGIAVDLLKLLLPIGVASSHMFLDIVPLRHCFHTVQAAKEFAIAAFVLHMPPAGRIIFVVFKAPGALEATGRESCKWGRLVEDFEARKNEASQSNTRCMLETPVLGRSFFGYGFMQTVFVRMWVSRLFCTFFQFFRRFAQFWHINE